MRVVVVASHPIQYQAPLFRELARRCDLHVLFAHNATATDQAAAGYNVEFEWDVDLASGYAHTFLTNVARRPGLEEFGGCDTPEVGIVLRGLRPGAVLMMGWHIKSFWQAIWAARCANIPIMVRGDSNLATPRSILKRAGKGAVYPIVLRTFNAALYVGDCSRRYWERYGYPKERMFFSPHCVDNDWFAARSSEPARRLLRERHGIAPNERVLLFAGRLIEFKRPLDVVAAAGLLGSQGMQVTIMVAGSGSLFDDIVTAARQRGVRLVPLGFCNQTEMPSVYAAADMLVLPSGSEETWGLVANEAIACSRPVVVSDACGCAPDLAADGSAGRVFRCGDVADLAAAIKAVFDLPPRLEAIEARARRHSLGAAVDGIIAAAQIVNDHRWRMGS